MLKDLINAIPISRVLNSGLDQHLFQSRPSCAPSGPALGSGLALVLIPDLVLPSWLVLSIYMRNEDTSSPSTLVMTTFLVSDRPGQMGLMMSFHRLAALELSADDAVL